MSDIQVQLEETVTGGSAFVGEKATPLAEMTFSKAGQSMIIINRTSVDDSLRGQGVGRKLLNKIVTMTREKGLKIIPLCPYAKSVFDKDESIRDVLRS